MEKSSSQPGENAAEEYPDIRISHTSNIYNVYKDVFDQFGENANRFYQKYGTFALEFLREYKIEGLILLEKYGKEMEGLYPLLDYLEIFQLYNNSPSGIHNLNIFSPKTLAEFYGTFGDKGIKYIADNPENLFLISEDKNRGIEIIELADEKGDIIFPLVRRHGLAFARLYDKDVLSIVIKFQEDGLLAIKEYGEKAKVLFNLFIDDEIFYHVIKTYGHKQTIPIVHLFYENKDFYSQVYHYIKRTNAYEWISSWWYDTSTPTANVKNDEAIKYENARRAVNLIFELGNDFLDRFEILDINNVREEAITIITNKVRNFFIYDIEKVSRKKIRQEDISLQDKLFAGLDILGFIPIGSGISKGTKLAVKGTRFAKTTKGFTGLLHLTDDLVRAYGDDAVRFAAKYGDDGIRVLKSTDGKILKLSQQYGDDVVRYVSKYGVNAGNVIEKYGDDIISLARKYGDDVIKYTSLYGDDGLKIIRRYGKDSILLSSVYGDNVIRLSILYGDNVIPYVSKYGSHGIRVMEKYGNDVIHLSKKYGDDVIKYVGIYGDDGLTLARKGKTGLFIMRFMPPKVFTKCVKFIKYGLAVSVLFAFVTHPLAFLSGIMKSLAWIFGTNPVIVAVIIGFIATFLLTWSLRKIKRFFWPFLVCFKVLKRLVYRLLYG